MNNFSINDHNHNLKYNLLHEFFWGFGVAFHTIYAVIPLFLKELSAPDYIIVSSAGIFSFVVAFPTLFSAGIGRNIKDIKRAVILVHCIILSVTFLMGFTFTFFDSELVGIAWEVYLTYLILYAFSIGIIVPIWTDFLNQTTLGSHRGRFFGLGFAFNSIGSFIGGITLKYLLSFEIEFPKNFGIGFFILFFSLMIGTILFLPFRIKGKISNKDYIPFSEYIAKTLEIVKGHKNFHRYLISRVFYSSCLPGLGLYAVYCQDKFNFELSEAGVFTVITVLSAAISSFFSGKFGDRYGHKNAMLLAYWGHLIAAFITILSWNMFSVYLVFIAVGIGQGAFMPSAMNLIYDFSSKRDVKTYMALVDSILAPFILFYIVLIGWLVDNGNYELSLKILIGSLMIGILSLVYLVDDPRKEKFM